MILAENARMSRGSAVIRHITPGEVSAVGENHPAYLRLRTAGRDSNSSYRTQVWKISFVFAAAAQLKQDKNR